MSKLSITVLVDSSAEYPFMPEFGLSLYIEYRHHHFLFDTGAGNALKKNSRLRGLNPEKFQNVILSHGHSDHTGGLACLHPAKIYCVPGVEKKRVSKHSDVPPHDLSMPETSRKVLHGSKIISVMSFQKIAPGTYLTGPVPRISGEDCGGNFFCDKGCTCIDTIEDDQSLLLDNGTLILGCCHSGIINTLEYCRKQHPEIQIANIVGGMHLLHADIDRLEKTVNYFNTLQILRIFPMHCTGKEQIDYLQKRLPSMQFMNPQVGDHIILE